MFKKFIITFMLCFGVFATTVFALDLDSFSVPSSYVSAIGDKWIATINSSGDVYIFPISEGWTVGNNVITSSRKTYYRYESYNKSWTVSNSDQCEVSSSYTVYYSGIPNPSEKLTNTTKIFNKSIGGLNFHKPSLGEIQKVELGNLMTAFGEKLKVLLPVGVSILAILLAPLLIRRLVAWFL